MTFSDRLNAKRWSDPADLPRVYYDSRLDAQLASELVGLARGVLADGRVSDSDVEALFGWLHAHEEVRDHFPGRELSKRLLRILDDGVVTEDERSELAAYLTAMIGGGPATTPTKLPLDEPAPPLVFNGSTFVFTGVFAFGKRDDCSALTKSLGGVVSRYMTLKTDYLVIGLLGSSQWITSAFGTKIVQAMQYRDDGRPIVICDEGHWLEQARRSPGAVEAR